MTDKIDIYVLNSYGLVVKTPQSKSLLDYFLSYTEQDFQIDYQRSAKEHKKCFKVVKTTKYYATEDEGGVFYKIPRGLIEFLPDEHFNKIEEGEHSIVMPSENLSDDDPSTAATIRLSRGNSAGTSDISYSYQVISLVDSNGTSPEFYIDSTLIYDGMSGSFTVGNVGAAGQTFSISEQGTVGEGDGFSIEIKTPDGSRTLCIVSWFKGRTVWTGNVSSDWSDVNNWILSDGTKTLAENLAECDLVIDSSCLRYPVLSSLPSSAPSASFPASSGYLVQSLTIAPNATLTITGGKLTSPEITVGSAGTIASITQSGGSLSVSNFKVLGNSRYSASGGELVFIKNDLTSADPVLSVGSLTNFTVNDFVVKSGSFTVPFELDVNGDFKNHSTVVCDEILNIYGDFFDEGTFSDSGSGSGKIVLKGSASGSPSGSGSSVQVFTPSTSSVYPKIEIDKESDGVVDFDSAFGLQVTDFIITKNGITNFNGSVTVSNFSDNADSGDIKFLNGGVISDDCTFVTPGVVVFGDSGTDSFSFGSAGDKVFSHIIGTTEFFGTVAADEISVGGTNLS